jgi:hypothetical protein
MSHWYKQFIITNEEDKVIIPDFELEQILNFSKRLVKQKIKGELKPSENPKVLLKSYYNGYIGEVALEHFLKMKFIHWKIREKNEKDMCDLKYLGINVGIKSSKSSDLPVLYPFPKNPEIITVIEPPATVYICGFASKAILNYYIEKNFSYGEAYEKGKFGFWGFKHLHRFQTFDELENLTNDETLDKGIIFTDKPYDYYPKSETINPFKE